MAQSPLINASKKIESLASGGKSPVFLVGFDGMVDDIIHVVDHRMDKDNFRRIPSIEKFGSRILSAVGKSSNIELVTTQRKIGGNAPLMSLALMGLGGKVTCMGTLGRPLHPIFKSMEENCRLVSLGEPGTTDALEFEDGKIMLGKVAGTREACWSNILKYAGEDNFQNMLFQSDLVACTNWTMLTELPEVLEHMIRLTPEEKPPTYFFDLADPEKRNPEELAAYFEQMKRLSQKAPCLLGLNLREAEQVSTVLKIRDSVEDSPEGTAQAADRIRLALGIEGVVIHAVGNAGASAGGGQAWITGPRTPTPKITTGAGDHFNGGFTFGWVSGLSLEESLYCGVATSGWYVRNGGPSPTLPDLMSLLKQWDEGTLKD